MQFHNLNMFVFPSFAMRLRSPGHYDFLEWNEYSMLGIAIKKTNQSHYSL